MIWEQGHLTGGLCEDSVSSCFCESAETGIPSAVPGPSQRVTPLPEFSAGDRGIAMLPKYLGPKTELPTIGTDPLRPPHPPHPREMAAALARGFLYHREPSLCPAQG